MHLDQEQRAAVESQVRRLLLVAGAGAGKTRVITERAAHLLDTVPPGRMLILSFTRAAAAEAGARVGARVQEVGFTGFPVIGTYHSWLAQQIRPYARDFGLPPDFFVADELDEEDLLRAAAWSAGHPKPFEAPLSALSTASLLAARDALARQAGALPYDGIETHGHTLVMSGALDQLYDVVLADEAQDLSQSQLEVIGALGQAGAALYLVGDPEQAIYDFRGARPDLLAAMPLERLYLPTNYRSVPDLVELANKLRDPTWGKIRPARQGGLHAVHHFHAPSRGHAAVEAVRKLLQDGFPAETIAVLCRSWKTVDECRLALVEAGYQLDAGADLVDPWATPAGRWLRRVLRVLARPQNPVLGALLHHPVDGVQPPFPLVSPRAWWTASGKAMLDRRGMSHVLNLEGGDLVAWGAITALRAMLPVNPPPAAELIVRALYAGLGAMCGPHPFLAGEVPEKLLSFCTGSLADLERTQGGGIQDRGPRSVSGIRVGTVHGAKGLEYNAVVLPDLSNSDYNETEEARRLLYVGMTRAREALALGVPLQGRRGEILRPTRWLDLL